MVKGTMETVLGKSSRVRGRLSGDGDVIVQGVLEGDVTLRGDFTLDEGALAQGNVAAHEVTLSGTLEGGVSAEGDVVLTASARVRGDISAASVSIEAGAELSGRLDSEFEMPPELVSSEGGSPAVRRR